MNETTIGDMGTFTKEQRWMIDNILNLLENQKSELTILTRRVTEIEIQNLKNLRKWENQKEKNEDVQLTLGEQREC